MANPQKAKGDAAERAVVAFLQSHGFPYAERTRAGWADDKGDVTGLGPIVIEVKNHARLDLAGWIAETETERMNARADHGILVVKRRGHADAGHWYAITTLERMAHLLTEAEYASPQDRPQPANETQPERTTPCPSRLLTGCATQCSAHTRHAHN